MGQRKYAGNRTITDALRAIIHHDKIKYQMKTRLGRTIILVDDYDTAFEFYRNNFFCEKLFDAILPNGQRYLHIRFSADDQTGIWFLKAESAIQKEHIGRQTGEQPTLVVYTDDCRKMYDHVQSNGVSIVEPVTESMGSIFFHCCDLYGNRITVVELTSSPSAEIQSR